MKESKKDIIEGEYKSRNDKHILEVHVSDAKRCCNDSEKR